MLSVREEIPCKLLSAENHSMEYFYVEVNLRKTKWLLCCSYHPIRCKTDFHLENVNQLYIHHIMKNFIIMGDFNVEANDIAISLFSDTYDLKNLIK